MQSMFASFTHSDVTVEASLLDFALIILYGLLVSNNKTSMGPFPSPDHLHQFWLMIVWSTSSRDPEVEVGVCAVLPIFNVLSQCAALNPDGSDDGIPTPFTLLCVVLRA